MIVLNHLFIWVWCIWFCLQNCSKLNLLKRLVSSTTDCSPTFLNGALNNLLYQMDNSCFKFSILSFWTPKRVRFRLFLPLCHFGLHKSRTLFLSSNGPTVFGDKCDRIPNIHCMACVVLCEKVSHLLSEKTRVCTHRLRKNLVLKQNKNKNKTKPKQESPCKKKKVFSWATFLK